MSRKKDTYATGPSHNVRDVQRLDRMAAKGLRDVATRYLKDKANIADVDQMVLEWVHVNELVPMQRCGSCNAIIDRLHVDCPECGRREYLVGCHVRRWELPR